MTESTRVMSRRTFLRDLGHGAVSLAVLGLAGCARGPALTVAPVTRTFDPLTYTGNIDEIEGWWCDGDLPSPPASQGSSGGAGPNSMHWARIGDVRASGYVLVRGGEATVVDTGPWCVPEVIEGALMAVGLDWSDVGSVIVTHKHPDHWVGLSAWLERAPDAVVFAGAADIPHIASPRPIVAVGAGDRVMDLAIIPTPGHTPGHIAAHDDAAGVLVVGDAVGIRPSDRKVALYGTTEDVEGAKASVRTLAGLSFDTFLPGHGDPIIGDGWDALMEYLDAG